MTAFLKKASLVLAVLVLGTAIVCASGSRFRLSTSMDIGLGAGSLALVGGNMIWERSVPVPSYSGTPTIALEELNPFDRAAVFPYDAKLDKVGTFAAVGLMAVPGVYAIAKGDGVFGYGLMYLEAMAMTYGVKELLKNLVVRERPYLYNGGYPVDELANGDYRRSFPSGHTAMAFASAAFLTTVMCLDDADSPWRIPTMVGSLAIATGIAASRVLSGNHYLTDVLAGAFIGASCGVAVPLLHTTDSNQSVSLDISPMGVSFGVRF